MSWEFSYAGQELPAPDAGGVGFELQPIDKADRNAKGDMVIDKIAMKRKLSVSWSRLKKEQAQKLFGVLENNRTGILEYYDISKGSQHKIKAYYGAGVKINYQRYDDDGTKQVYTSASVNFIEM